MTDFDDWDVTIPTDDVSITRRRRAIAPVQALADIDRTKSHLDGDHWDHYDLVTLCLAVIDQVALAMGISAGRTWESMLDYATGQAARQRPGAPRSEHRAVAERVLVSLVTTDVNEASYVTHDDTGQGPQWRAQRFRLLYLHTSGPDDAEHLRASEQAINLFIDALDLDVEAAQIANEAQIAALVARGALDAAVHVARAARYRSIQYQEQVRRITADTLIDPDTHDWVHDVPELLDAALGHVADRLANEAALLDAVADRRSDAVEAAHVDEANKLVALLRECRHRHDDLHRHLIGARARLRTALDERFSRPARTARRYHLGRDLLEPFLARATVDAETLAPTLVATVGGLAVRWWPSMAVVVDELCAPPRAVPEGEEFEPGEFADDDVPEWWEAVEEVADSVLGGIDGPTRLSQLLERAETLDVVDHDDEPIDVGLLAAAITHGAHRAWAARLAGRSAGDHVVVAVATGGHVDRYGVRAQDLVLVPATITDDIAAPEPNVGQLFADASTVDEFLDMESTP